MAILPVVDGSLTLAFILMTTTNSHFLFRVKGRKGGGVRVNNSTSVVQLSSKALAFKFLGLNDPAPEDVLNHMTCPSVAVGLRVKWS